jgi:hypothetical protein
MIHLSYPSPADATIREILRRSFQLVFPVEGGAGAAGAAGGNSHARGAR